MEKAEGKDRRERQRADGGGQKGKVEGRKRVSP
jgi:hypothetical protein